MNYNKWLHEPILHLDDVVCLFNKRHVDHVPAETLWKKVWVRAIKEALRVTWYLRRHPFPSSRAPGTPLSSWSPTPSSPHWDWTPSERLALERGGWLACPWIPFGRPPRNTSSNLRDPCSRCALRYKYIQWNWSNNALSKINQCNHWKLKEKRILHAISMVLPTVYFPSGLGLCCGSRQGRTWAYIRSFSLYFFSTSSLI